MVENDLKPCYVFDGKPPQLKSNVVSLSKSFDVGSRSNGPLIVLSIPVQLKKRFSNRQEAKEDEVEAKEVGSFSFPFQRLRVSVSQMLLRSPTGTTEDVDKLSRRQVKVTKEHNDECKKLLTLMGIPWVEVSLAWLFSV